MRELIERLEELAAKPKTRPDHHWAARPVWSLEEQNWLHNNLSDIAALLRARQEQ